MGISSTGSTEELQQYTQEARGLVKQFASQLQSELKSALKTGGSVEAIKVCNHKAPDIADALEESSHWHVGRTSLKLRSLNDTPDAWETRVLQEFEQRKANGEAVKDLEHAEVVTRNGVKTFRYMKAIPTKKICLRCHGKEIHPSIAKQLDIDYPFDQARNYSLGDIRGAFTLSKPLE